MTTTRHFTATSWRTAAVSPGGRPRSRSRSSASSARSPSSDILEFGCGAAQWSIALAGLGARPVGLDLSERQLGHALRLMSEAGVTFPLIHGSGEAVPLPDASFDIVFCDHGAMSFADPYRTVPEVARVLRPGGLFAFNPGAPGEHLLAGRRRAPRPAWRSTTSGSTGSRTTPVMLPAATRRAGSRLFRASGFVIEDLIELRPADDAVSTYRDPRIWRGPAAGRPRSLAVCDAPEGRTSAPIRDTRPRRYRGEGRILIR